MAAPQTDGSKRCASTVQQVVKRSYVFPDSRVYQCGRIVRNRCAHFAVRSVAIIRSKQDDILQNIPMIPPDIRHEPDVGG